MRKLLFILIAMVVLDGCTILKMESRMDEFVFKFQEYGEMERRFDEIMWKFQEY